MNGLGYNLDEINNLMKQIVTYFDSVKNVISEEWNQVVNVLQAEWVGDDEQSFEENLAEKINKLYIGATGVVNGILKDIESAAKAWYDAQGTNALNGATIARTLVYNLEVPQIEEIGNLVEKKEVAFTSSMTMGLVNGNPSAIKQALFVYVTKISDTVKGIFDQIDTAKAFLGQFSEKLTAYVQRVGILINDVLTAVNDLFVALDSVAGKNYEDFDMSLGTEVEKSETAIDQASSALGESKWDGAA